MSKLNITEGIWRAHKYNSLGQWADEVPNEIHIEDEDGITIGVVDPWGTGGNLEMGNANAKAIVTAVNSTYKKGLDPEAYEEVVKALQSVCESLSDTVDNGDALYLMPSVDLKIAQEALKKARINE